MKNFRIKGKHLVCQNKGTRLINGKNCYITGEYSGIEVSACELVDEDYWPSFYIRLVNYDNAVKIIDYARSINADGGITVGGFWITASKDMWMEIINYIESLKIRYELCTEHPTAVTDGIVKQWRKDGKID